MYYKLFHKRLSFVFQNSEVQLFCSNVYDEIAFGPRQMGMNEDEVKCSTHDFEYVKQIFKRAIVFSKDHTIIRDGDYEEIMEDRKFLYENNII